jgi:hypothetical protein
MISRQVFKQAFRVPGVQIAGRFDGQDHLGFVD